MNKKVGDKEIILKLLSTFKDSIGTKKYYLVFIFGFLTSIVSILEPFLFIKIIHYIEEFYKTGAFDIKKLGFYMIYWGVFIAFYLLLTYINRYYFIDKSNLKYYVYVFKKYSKKILSISYGDFLGKKAGELYSRLNKGIKDSFGLLFFFFMEIIRSMSGIILVIIVLFIVNPIMTIASISMLPVMIFMGMFYNKRTVELQKEINDFDDKNYGILADSITNTYLVKNLILEKKFFSLLSKNIRLSYDKQLTVSKRWSFLDIYTGVLVMISRVIVILTGSYLISIGKLSLSMLFLYFSFIGWIYFPLSFVFTKLRHIKEQLTTVGKFFEEFDNLELEKGINYDENIKKYNTKGDIEFKNVEFGYSKDKLILKNINFKINAGEKIAFVGNTGSGKSTIINLIFRLWEINKGEILLDGNNIKNINKSHLRNSIGLVAQDNSLFNLSIKENLLFAKEEASDEEIKNALTLANADFVYDLKDGIDTVIGERGLKLSGGEKQRLSIARLFLKNPEIIILDEATSALDNKTEKLIQKSIDKLLKGKTSIIIAHRLSTIKNVDKIFMVEDGKIIESGKYDELIKKGGKFNELVNPEHLILN
ncbi:hypothetical protein CSA08_03300 [Candidatus Gracilibacteria bacterium]|nr:MAG: hypothetical protein CSA08_03300 [Candidatus Gracilibacteria bacterium]